jgi:hypothetical protein
MATNNPVDATDALLLVNAWLPDPANAASFNAGMWQTAVCPAATANCGNPVGTSAWFLPSTIPGCGSENEPTCEPIGKWYLPGFTWTAAIVAGNNYIINDPNGAASDIIILDNTGGPGKNAAAITFSSDPTLVPEPAFGLPVGVVAVALIYFRRRLVVGGDTRAHNP